MTHDALAAKVKLHGENLRMAAERLSIEAQLRSTGYAGEEERLRAKMGSIAADLFRLGAPFDELGASLLAELTAANASVKELEAENARLSTAVCSGVLGDLLTADEGAVLTDFVKSLRGGVGR